MTIIIVLSLFYLFANRSVKNRVLAFVRHHRVITALILLTTIFIAVTDLFPSIFFIFAGGVLRIIIPVFLIVSIIFLVAGMFLVIYHMGKKIL